MAWACVWGHACGMHVASWGMHVAGGMHVASWGVHVSGTMHVASWGHACG